MNARLNNPRGISIVASTGRIYVADGGNSRVLSWPSASSFGNGISADIVITADRQSPGLSFQNPDHMIVDGQGSLYVADTENNRVLKFNAPITNNVVASIVLGQPDFNSNALNNGGVVTNTVMNGPSALAIDANNNLYVADSSNHRILRFNFPVNTTFKPASLVIGQPNFTTNGPNQGGLSASTVNDPFGIAFDGQGNLYVSDTFNNRILKFFPPFTNGMAATRVIGQTNFNSFAGGVSATKLQFPWGLVVNSIGHILVADEANNRVMEFPPPTSDGIPAFRVFGQPNFNSGAQNYPFPPGDATSSNFWLPWGVALDANQNLYTVENFNHRVLGFDKPTSVYFFPLVFR